LLAFIMTSTLASAFSALSDPSALQARIAFSRHVSAALDKCGRTLWAFGLYSDTPGREAIAIVTQIAADLSAGTIELYSRDNWYAGAALVRQLIETEYLLFLFGQLPSEAIGWRQSDHALRRSFFSPAQMRRRSEGRFRSDEYAAHCERGGHPTPLAHSFLEEHGQKKQANIWLWSDLAQHLERIWFSFCAAVDALHVAHVRVVADSRAQFQSWLDALCADDPAYGWFDLGSIPSDGEQSQAQAGAGKHMR
jgi:hypothetical protein